MALLSVANLVYSIGARRLLDGVNLTLSEGEHVGLVGRNGCGKSTLMKVICGQAGHQADAGQAQLARGASVGYLSQDPMLDEKLTCREEAATAFAKLHKLHQKLERLTEGMSSATGEELERLMKRYERVEEDIQTAGGYTVDHRIDATLHGLGLGDEVFGVPVGGLSGGQKGRLALAKLLLSEPDVLLLDEPTNHLDINGREWLEQFLKGYRGAVILVSHDRWLLDRVVSKIYEFGEGQLDEYPGDYSAFRAQRVERRLARQRVYDKTQTKIRQEQQFIDRYRAGQRASQAQGREKRLERFKRDEAVEAPAESGEINLTLAPPARCGDRVITADGVSKRYEDKVLFAGLDIEINRGDRVGIVGPNGAGKSTLVRALLGDLAPDSGKVRIGSGVDVGHYRQSHEGLDLNLTVVQYLQRFVPGETEQAGRDLAGAFLFSGQEQDKPLGVLSGGERSRAVLAGLVAGGHNLLVLDEPTNHLDISSAERLEVALRQFTAERSGFGQKVSGGGTLILITHDRMLLQDLVDHLIVLDGDGKAEHFFGSYSEYAESVRRAAEREKEVRDAGAKVRAAQVRPAKRADKRAGKGARGKSDKAPAGALSKLNHASLENRIEKIESRLRGVDEAMADPGAYRDAEGIKRLQAEREGLAQELAPLEAEWARRAEG